MAPIIYINNQDVNEFCIHTMQEQHAHAYEWEGESVIHIHLNPLLHGFGKESPAIFTKELALDKYVNNFRFVIQITQEKTATVRIFENTSDGPVKREVTFIPEKKELYSRNKGILELGILENKRVMIVGLGSFGAQIAIELAKAGVGNYALFDFDRVELHNLSRHICTIQDLGRLKTDAVYDAIKGKNPYAKVEKYAVNINNDIEFLDDQVKKSDLVICATDNNMSRINISKSLVKNSKVGLFGRAITRAEGGDVFRYRPGGACYGCVIDAAVLPREEISDIVSARTNGVIPAYVNQTDAEASVQVGLSSDIQPICNLMVKLALLELSRGLKSGIGSLEEDFRYDCYLWANRRDRNYGNWHPFYQAGKERTIMRWYGVNVPKDGCCPICSTKVILDTDQSCEYHNGEIDFGNLTGIKPEL